MRAKTGMTDAQHYRSRSVLILAGRRAGGNPRSSFGRGTAGRLRPHWPNTSQGKPSLSRGRFCNVCDSVFPCEFCLRLCACSGRKSRDSAHCPWVRASDPLISSMQERSQDCSGDRCKLGIDWDGTGRAVQKCSRSAAQSHCTQPTRRTSSLCLGAAGCGRAAGLLRISVP